MSLLRKGKTAVRRLPSVSLLLAAIAVAVQFSPAALNVLQYDRDALAAGEVWRVVTCHLTHCSFDHLIWDVGVLLVLGWLCETRGRRQWAMCVLLSSLAIPPAIWLTIPDLHTYRGLSGIDSALFVLLAAKTLRESMADRDVLRGSATTLLLCGFVAKTIYEVVTTHTIFVDSTAAGMVPVPLAHIVGGNVGLLALLCDGRLLPHVFDDRPKKSDSRGSSGAASS